MEHRAKEARAKALAADLEHLDRRRRTLINRRSAEAYKLVCAIDDYAGHLSGDRTVLHMRGHSIP